MSINEHIYTQFGSHNSYLMLQKHKFSDQMSIDQSHARERVCTRTHTQRHTHMHAHKHTHTQCVYVCVCICVCAHICTHTHTTQAHTHSLSHLVTHRATYILLHVLYTIQQLYTCIQATHICVYNIYQMQGSFLVYSQKGQ